MIDAIINPNNYDNDDLPDLEENKDINSYRERTYG